MALKDVRITLTEFSNPKVFSPSQIKDWFPSEKFDRRFPWDCVKKWINVNKNYLEFLGIRYSWDNEKGLTLEPSNKIGLVPIKNPFGNKTYGSITVKPKIGWIKISEIFDSIDWKLKPEFLDGEEPIMGDGVLPRWIKALDTLNAIEKALSRQLKGMNVVLEVRDNPIGRTDWNEYSKKHLPQGNWNKFDCNVTDYSLDLSIHRQFKGVIALIEKDLLNGYVPTIVGQKAKPMLRRIKKKLIDVKAEFPNIKKLKLSDIPLFYRSVYGNAISRVIEYISQSRFSIYSAEFFGPPWRLETDRLFEYWVEFWSYNFSKQIGANFYSDIRGNAKIRFLALGKWGGLKVLKPDIIIDKNEQSIVMDVKYKKHLLFFKMGNFTEDIAEEHRRDIHQILAYVASSHTTYKKAVLIYPRLLEDSITETAEVINYKNSNMNLKVIKTDTSFQSDEFLNKLYEIWTN